VKHDDLVPVAWQLVLTIADLAREVQVMPETAPDQISKYAFYLVAEGSGPKVVRLAARGWGATQRRVLLDATRDDAASGKGGRVTAVVRSYGDEFKQAIVVDAYYRDSQITMEFPYRVGAGELIFDPSLDQMKEPVATALAEWASKTKPKGFLGLF
jgi:hypothetical protein